MTQDPGAGNGALEPPIALAAPEPVAAVATSEALRTFLAEKLGRPAANGGALGTDGRANA